MEKLLEMCMPCAQNGRIYWKEGKAWCLWETDTIERLEGIMAQFQNVHTDVMPVKLAPQLI